MTYAVSLICRFREDFIVRAVKNIGVAEKLWQNRIEKYGSSSITSLKGADRVRLRPAVIFGSDGIEGCQHSVLRFFQTP